MESKLDIFTGSIVALVTPMSADGQIDEMALRRLVDWHLESGSHGLVIMGTTGESSLVSETEHVRAVQVAIEHSAGRIPIIAGCGNVSTSKTLELVNRINPLKPDGFLCVTPYYVKPTQTGLIQHYQKVADACEAPLLLYNVPGRTACDLSVESTQILAQHSGILGLKDATGDLDRLRQLRSQLPQGFILLSGDDESSLEFVKNGGQGVITVTGNLDPARFSRWCRLALAGDFDGAEKEFNPGKVLNQVLFVESNPIPVKWALAKMGKIDEYIRLPLTAPEHKTQLQVTRALEDLGLI